MKELTLILEDDEASLIEPNGDELWNSDDDDDFDYTHDTDAEEVIAHLLATSVIAEEREIIEVAVDRGGSLDAEGYFDEGDDDDADNDDEDDDENDDESEGGSDD